MTRGGWFWCRPFMTPKICFATGLPSGARCRLMRWIAPSEERSAVAAFDTNVLVRVLVGDDPAQTRKAERAFIEHARGDGVFVSLVVLAETAWVLSAAYEWDQATIHD